MNSNIIPQTPDLEWLNSFVHESLVKAPGYELDAPEIKIKLDQNESPWDWPSDLKDSILKDLASAAWNRYPQPFPIELQKMVAKHVGVAPENILLSPGSNHLISVLLNVFTQNNSGKVVIARPSFPLYEAHCRYMGISYEPWCLNESFDYDIGLLPDLTPGSIVLFASPNNPTGTSLSYKAFEGLLLKNPKVLFMADEAYFEFAEEPYTPLLEKHNNLILIRTFSKTLGTAGLRLGYMVGHQSYIELTRKLMLPFTINVMTDVALRYVLNHPEAKKILEKNINNAKSERSFLYSKLLELAKKQNFKVKASEANFLLVQWPSNQSGLAAYGQLIAKGILVRNVTRGPGLAGCLRITVGTREENLALLAALTDFSGA